MAQVSVRSEGVTGGTGNPLSSLTSKLPAHTDTHNHFLLLLSSAGTCSRHRLFLALGLGTKPLGNHDPPNKNPLLQELSWDSPKARPSEGPYINFPGFLARCFLCQRFIYQLWSSLDRELSPYYSHWHWHLWERKGTQSFCDMLKLQAQSGSKVSTLTRKDRDLRQPCISRLSLGQGLLNNWLM